jgi:hypothetical protein
VAKFVVPREEEVAKVEGLSDVERNWRVGEGRVPQGWRFPGKFKSIGIRGHRYHVFNEPRYYNYE